MAWIGASLPKKVGLNMLLGGAVNHANFAVI